MKNHKYKLLYVVYVLLIVVVVASPLFYFHVIDGIRYNKRQPMKKISYSLDSDVKNVAMVQRIHEYLNSYYISASNVTIFEATGDTTFQLYVTEGGAISKELAENIKRLEQLEGLKEYFLPLEPYIHLTEQSEEVTYEEDTKTTTDIIQYEYDWKTEKISLLYDNKSNRAIGIEYRGKKETVFTKEKKHKLLQSFLEYCNLSIVDDWYFNGESMISEKAHLKLVMDSDKDGWKLGFALQE